MTTIASATDDTIQVITRDKGQKGDTGTQGLDGAGFDTVRSSLLDSPLFRFGVPNKIAHTLKGTLTVTRASTATYVDRFGVVRTAAIDEAREEKEGILIEGQSTNLFTYSRDFTNSAWTKTSCSITSSTETSSDLTATADKITPNNGVSLSDIRRVYSFDGSSSYTISVDVKADGFSEIVFSAGNSSVFSGNAHFSLEGIGSVVSGSGKIKKLYGGWYRLEVPGISSSAGATNVLLAFAENGSTSISGDGVKSMLFDFAQLEALPSASSRIPTTTATATRLADQISAQGEGNVPLLTDAFSIYMKVKIIGFLSPQSFFEIGYGSATASKLFTGSDSAGGIFTTFGGLVSKFGQSSNIFNEQIDCCVTHSGNSLSQYVDGEPSPNNPLADVAPPSLIPDKITIGINYSLTGRNLWGHIKDFRIYDFELNADEVAYLSGGE